MTRALTIPFLLAAAVVLLAIAYGVGPVVVLHPADPAVRITLTVFGLAAVPAVPLLRASRSPS